MSILTKDEKSTLITRMAKALHDSEKPDNYDATDMRFSIIWVPWSHLPECSTYEYERRAKTQLRIMESAYGKVIPAGDKKNISLLKIRNAIKQRLMGADEKLLLAQKRKNATDEAYYTGMVRGYHADILEVMKHEK